MVDTSNAGDANNPSPFSSIAVDALDLAPLAMAADPKDTRIIEEGALGVGEAARVVNDFEEVHSSRLSAIETAMNDIFSFLHNIFPSDAANAGIQKKM